jgi:hypothetical protein
VEKDVRSIAVTISRSQFFQLIAGGSAWLVSSGFAQKIKVLTPAEAEAERMRTLEADTISSVAIGDREIEKKFNQQGVETSVIRTDGRSGRRASQWFSYDLPVNGHTIVTLVATYNSDQRRPRSFDVIVDGQKLASESQPESSLSKFYEKEYVIPAELMRHKETLTVRFEATNGLEVTPVFGVRLLSR